MPLRASERDCRVGKMGLACQCAKTLLDVSSGPPGYCVDAFEILCCLGLLYLCRRALVTAIHARLRLHPDHTVPALGSWTFDALLFRDLRDIGNFHRPIETWHIRHPSFPLHPQFGGTGDARSGRLLS